MHIIQFYRVTVGYHFSISLQWEHISLSANKALDHSFIFTCFHTTGTFVHVLWKVPRSAPQKGLRADVKVDWFISESIF